MRRLKGKIIKLGFDSILAMASVAAAVAIYNRGDLGSLDALVRQAYSPVRWIETVAAMASNGVGAVIECGPGKVLAGLTKRIARDVQGAAVVDAASLADAIALAGGEA